MFHEFNLENTSVRQLGKGFKPFLGPSDSLFSSSLKQARTKREEQEIMEDNDRGHLGKKMYPNICTEI